jgi:hypothetical protein
MWDNIPLLTLLPDSHKDYRNLGLTDESTFSYYSEESTGGDAVWKPTKPPHNWK